MANKNHEDYLKYQREYYQRNKRKEYKKRYYEENREKNLADQKKWREEHKLYLREYRRRYYLKKKAEHRRLDEDGNAV